MQILSKLKKSRFRRSFKLSEKNVLYIREKGFEEIKRHAMDFLKKRIKTNPKNDGRQTPFKGHPVFVAQHATATCCRKCIEKWHKFPQNKELSEKEINYLSSIIMSWIAIEIKNHLKL